MSYVGQQRHREKKNIGNLSVKGQISPSYIPTSKVIVLYIFSIWVFRWEKGTDW
jgi:hypothetical protein